LRPVEIAHGLVHVGSCGAGWLGDGAALRVGSELADPLGVAARRLPSAVRVIMIGRTLARPTERVDLRGDAKSGGGSSE
jgi:hypothetical protein